MKVFYQLALNPMHFLLFPRRKNNMTYGEDSPPSLEIAVVVFGGDHLPTCLVLKEVILQNPHNTGREPIQPRGRV